MTLEERKVFVDSHNIKMVDDGADIKFTEFLPHKVEKKFVLHDSEISISSKSMHNTDNSKLL